MRRSYPQDPSSSGGMSGGHSFTHEMIENENDHLVNALSGKVAALKSLSIDIGDEVRSQNTILRDMDSDFDNTGGLLGSSMKRVKNMAKAGHNRWMCYMILFIVLVFFIVYYIVKWRSN
ncbi:BET1 homolog [Dysidea avara]|uniref:BET1 homolog n=1 Tax=Dysidea avara TaxID=196820 RepID=UPI00332232CD